MIWEVNIIETKHPAHEQNGIKAKQRCGKGHFQHITSTIVSNVQEKAHIKQCLIKHTALGQNLAIIFKYHMTFILLGTGQCDTVNAFRTMKPHVVNIS